MHRVGALHAWIGTHALPCEVSPKLTAWTMQVEDDDDLAAIEDDRDVDGAVHVVDEEPTTAGTGAGLAARFETAALEAFLRAQDRRLAAARGLWQYQINHSTIYLLYMRPIGRLL